MTPSARLLKQPETFRRLTGLTPVAFDRLLTDVTAAWEAAQARRGRRKGRKRRIGAGPPFALALADRLLMLLIYYRTYVPHAFLGFLFGIDDSTVCRSNRRIEPLLAGVFRIPERTVELSPDEIRELFFDATERPTNRPERGQKAFYSGKKKRHTSSTRSWWSGRRRRRAGGRSRGGCGSRACRSRSPARRTTSGCTTGRAW